MASLPLHAADEIPSVGQPTANFYFAKGSRVRVEWILNRTTVPEDEEILATLVVTGVTNPRQVVKPDLRKLDAYESRFVITEHRDPLPNDDATAVRFSYRLRPRNRSVDKFPTLLFHYYNPAAADGKQFPMTTAKFDERLTITAPRPKAKPAAIPLAEPEHLFAITTGTGVLGQPFSPGKWGWIANALLGPLAVAGWFVAWRHVYPDAARQARIRRTRAARRAIDAIGRADRAPDPAAAIASAAMGYLRSRFPLPYGATTPTEVAAALVELGQPDSIASEVADFLRECDALRFGPSGDIEPALAADAEALVVRLEGTA